VIELTQDAGGRAQKITGAYALEGEQLTICLPLPDRKVPKKIPAAPTSGLVRLVLKKSAGPR